VKSYAAAGQSLLLLFVIPAYAALARRVGRVRLLVTVYGFFVANLLVFAALLQAGVEIGIWFYLWVGVFNNTAVAQLWGFANDLYTPEQGKRLFAVLGIGSSVGAVAGAFVAKRLALLGPMSMQLMAAGFLVLCVLLVVLVDRYDRTHRRGPAATRATEARPPLEGPALQLLLNDKYLLWIALLTFVLNCVNTTGEYLLDRTLLEMISETGASPREASRAVASFKADYFGWVNLVGVVLQLFVVSRVLRVLGVARALFILPVVAFITYGSMWLTPVLALVRLGKIAENSLDYSLQNTARQALFLVGTRAEKYLGKTVIDTFVVRMGDVFSAALIYSASVLHLPSRTFALVNLGFVVCWLLVVVGLGREHARRSAEHPAAAEG
jgi:AAA family ATP:ADP antiporter